MVELYSKEYFEQKARKLESDASYMKDPDAKERTLYKAGIFKEASSLVSQGYEGQSVNTWASQTIGGRLDREVLRHKEEYPLFTEAQRVELPESFKEEYSRRKALGLSTKDIPLKASPQISTETIEAPIIISKSSGASLEPYIPPTSAQPYNLYQDMTFGEKVKYLFGKYTSSNFWSNVGKEFAGTGEKQTPFINTLPTVFAPFQVFAPERIGDIRTPELYRQETGILGYDYLTGRSTLELAPQSKIGGETGYERLSRALVLDRNLAKPAEQLSYETARDIEKSLAPQYMERIKAGEERTKVEGEYQQAFQKQYQTEISNKLITKNIYDLQNYQMSKYAFNIPKALTTSTVIAGSVVAPVTTGGYIFASGQALGYEGIAEKDYKKILLGFGVSNIGAYGSLRSVASEVTQARIEHISEVKPKLYYDVRIPADNRIYDTFISYQDTGSAQAFTRRLTQSRMTGSTSFESIGRTDVLIKTADFWTDKTLMLGSGQTIKVTGVTAPGKISPSVFEVTSIPRYDYSAILGKGVDANIKYYVQAPAKTDYSAGITASSNDFMLSASGRISNINLKKIFSNQGDVFSSTKIDFPLEDITIARIIRPESVKQQIYFDPYASSVRGNIPSASLSPPSSLSIGTGLASNIPRQIKLLSSQQATISPNLLIGAGSITNPALISKQASRSALRLSSSQLPVIKVLTKNMTKPKTKIITVLSPASLSNVKVLQTPRSSSLLNQLTSQAQAQRSAQSLVQSSIGAQIAPGSRVRTPGFNIPIKPSIPIIPIIPIRLAGGVGLGIRQIGAKVKYGYTPSFEALVFRIFGKRPTGVETGLRLRPIPINFDWSKEFGRSQYKMINPIKVKI